MASFTNQTKSSTTLTNQSKTGFSTRDDLPNSFFDGYTGDDVIPGSGGKTLDQLAFNDPVQSYSFTNQTKSTTAYSNATKN